MKNKLLFNLKSFINFLQQRYKCMQELLSRFFHRNILGKRSSVFSVLIMMLLIIIPASLYAITNTNDLFVRIFCGSLVVIVLFFSISIYIYLLIKNPRLLHSEEYLVEDKRLDIMAKQGELPRLISDVDSIKPDEKLLEGKK